MDIEKEMITVEDAKGEKREAEVVLCFQAGEDQKDYVVYTFNEEDEKGMIILYAATVSKVNDEVELNKVSSEEWNMIKKTMQEIAKEGGTDE